MGSFFGYYVKCQGANDTVAVIFGTAKNGKKSEDFVQIITKDDSHYTEHTDSSFLDDRRMTLDISDGGLLVKGDIKFGDFTPIKGDIMGPFKFLPFMECRHMLVSMRHKINGEISVNGRVYNFDNGIGYIEGDRGKGFPRKYLWTQCHLDSKENQIDVSAACAIIPYLGIRFKGTICVVMVNGRGFRLATYNRARVKQFDERGLVVKKGKYELSIMVFDEITPHPLKAPTNGSMNRVIYESINRHVRYTFKRGNKIIFDETSNRAAFEYSDISNR